MKAHHYITILATSLVLWACGNSKNTTSSASVEEKNNPDVKKAIMVTDISPYESSTPTTIEKVALEGNILTIKVSYSGGCKDHEFELVGNKMITKSLPPKRGIFLYHNGNGDHCREHVTEELQFDITVFAYLDQEILIRLQGWEPYISYTLAK